MKLWLPTVLVLGLAGSLLSYLPTKADYPRSGASTDEREPFRLPSGKELLDYVETVKPGVVAVISTDADGVDIASGSGFVVGPDRVITNHQVIARGVSARVLLGDGIEAPVKSVLAEDREVNLVLLEVELPSITKPLPLASTDPVKGDELLLVANPVGQQHSMSMGTVHGTDTRDGIEGVVRVQTRYSAGSTGSPLVNGAGEVVAVAAFAKFGGESEKFAVPRSRIVALEVKAEGTVPISLGDYHTTFGPALVAAGDANVVQPVNPKDMKIEAEIVKQEDGSLLIDGQYVVRGSGTEADPYRMTWDLLISAVRVFQPREGRDDLPERVTMFHDKWVSLSGFVAFPLMVQESDEVLFMLNQWDGCCIGVPPTPYDAIEVTLRKEMALEGGINIFNYGTITGKLKVDPYVVNKWLVGLYLMEDAKLKLEM